MSRNGSVLKENAMATLCLIMLMLLMLLTPVILKSGHHTVDHSKWRQTEPKSPRVLLNPDDSGMVFSSHNKLPTPLVELQLNNISIPARRNSLSLSLPTKNFDGFRQATIGRGNGFPKVVPLPSQPENDLSSLIFDNLLLHTLQHYLTIIVFHDESLRAQEVIQNYLSSETKRPVIISSMIFRKDDNNKADRTSVPDTNAAQISAILSPVPSNIGNKTQVPSSVYVKELQAKKYATITSVCVVIFEVSEVVESFFASAEPEWFPTNVVLVRLTGKRKDLRPVFSHMNSFRNVGVLELSASGRGKDVLQVITHKPFAPKSQQMVTKVVLDGDMEQMARQTTSLDAKGKDECVKG
ncbi:uncharacterized protein LOC143036546 [Oratosquilla oratoria]|uniref:uncharacterized protein LOC143036546 n=1 Tax=Oratosquilla oratoria TaxID=337810 RepID=UPI003F7637BC